MTLILMKLSRDLQCQAFCCNIIYYNKCIYTLYKIVLLALFSFACHFFTDTFALTLGIGLGYGTPLQCLDRVRKFPTAVKRWHICNCLIIDEI